MAKDGAIYVKVTNYNTLVFRWYETNQNNVTGETTIQWHFELVATDYGAIVSSGQKDWSVTLDGKTTSGTVSINMSSNRTKTIGSGSATLKHASDGTKSFSVSFSLQLDITFAGVAIGTKTGSGSFSLNAVSVAKSLSLSSTQVDMGKALTISVANPSSSETYDIDYTYGSEGYTNIATGLKPATGALSLSTTWTVPESLAEKIPNSMSLVLILRCTTKVSGTVIGTKTTAFTAKVPDYWPSIDSVTFVEATPRVKEAELGFFVQGVSKLKFNIAASGYRGSTITSIKTTYGDKTYNGAEWTSEALSRVGDNVFQITITDSRGRTQSGPKTVTGVVAYSEPAITAFSASRVDTDGNASDEGKKVRAPMSYSYASLEGKNTVSLQIDYKKSIDSSWSKLWSLSEHTSGSTIALPATELSADYVYDLRLTVRDIVGSKVTATVKLPAGSVIFDIKANGRGIAFFTTSTKDGVTIEGQLPHTPQEIEMNARLYTLQEPGYYVADEQYVVESVMYQLPAGLEGPFAIEVRSGGDGVGGWRTQTLHAESGVWSRITYQDGMYVDNIWTPVFLGGGSKILWSGSNQMGSGSMVSLYPYVEHCPNGIVLVFSRYASGAAQDYLFSSHFVPRALIMGGGLVEYACVFNMATTKFDYISSKYLYISSSYIAGHADNVWSGTTNGITFNNGQFALRYVIGV